MIEAHVKPDSWLEIVLSVISAVHESQNVVHSKAEQPDTIWMSRFFPSSGFVIAALSAFLLLFIPQNAEAEPRLPYLFTDHMVLQQNADISVWGWADPEEHIAVTLGADVRETVASAEGHWSVSLPAMHEGGPFTLIVRGKKAVEVKDVLLGEVWIASGQSNMTYALSGATGAAEEIPAANYPQMRFFTVPKKIALTPQDNTLPAAWEICTPETALPSPSAVQK